VTPVGWPPLLAIDHQVIHVFFECSKIQLLNFLAVVEVLTQWVGLGVVLVQDI
jgi:hypothetical protein